MSHWCLNQFEYDGIGVTWSIKFENSTNCIPDRSKVIFIEFIKERLWETPAKHFWEPLRKCKVSTYGILWKLSQMKGLEADTWHWCIVLAASGSLCDSWRRHAESPPPPAGCSTTITHSRSTVMEQWGRTIRLTFPVGLNHIVQRFWHKRAPWYTSIHFKCLYHGWHWYGTIGMVQKSLDNVQWFSSSKWFRDE